MSTVAQPATKELRFLQNIATVHLDGAATGGSVGLVELTGPQGDMPPLHVHHREDEAFYVLEGRMTFFVGNETVEFAAGGCMFAPRGVAHAYRVESTQARWLALASPAGFERFVREVADAGTVAPEAVTEIAARYGIEILGPPGTLPA